MTNPPDRPVRLAILGAGAIGTIHALCAQQAPETDVAAVWSRTPARAEALAARLGAAPAVTVEEAVGREDVEAVLVATPTFRHEEDGLAAIRAGKHVICEKPLACDLASAQRMIDAARVAGVQLLVGHVLRFFPEFVRLHELIGQGAIGRPALVRMSRVASFPHGSGEWHNDLARSGGAVFDMAIHDFDWLLWTLGPVERVYGRGLVERNIPFTDYGLVTLRFASGAMAHVESSWAEIAGFRVHGEISGDRGMLTYDSLDSVALKIELRRPPDTPPGVNVPTSQTVESPTLTQLRHFARCIRGQEAPIIAPEEAYEALHVALAAMEAIRTGQVVTL